MKNKFCLLSLPLVIVGLLSSYIVFQHTQQLTLSLLLILWMSTLFGTILYQNHHYQRQLGKMLELQQASVSALVDLARSRDDEVTGSHLHRLGFYAEILAQDLGLSEELKENIIKTIALHDIGKVAVPDHILNKPGPLDATEWAIIQQHPLVGAAVLESIPSDLAVADPSFMNYLDTAKEIALCHHEKWDGSGYPHGLKGEEIPFSARLAAICDVYDSLRSPRPYKKSFTHEEAVVIITSGKGTHFDPQLVNSFTRLAHRFDQVWDEQGEIMCRSS